jgi:hypothetical protein
MAHAQETRFCFSVKRTSLFNPLNSKLNPICHFLALSGAHPILHVSRIRVKLAGASVRSTTGSWGLRISGSNAGYTMFRVVWRVLATHSIRQFPRHFPSRASPCAITFQKQSTYASFGIAVFAVTVPLVLWRCVSRNFQVYFQWQRCPSCYCTWSSGWVKGPYTDTIANDINVKFSYPSGRNSALHLRAICCNRKELRAGRLHHLLHFESRVFVVLVWSE